MAVQRPHSRVVRVKLDDCVPWGYRVQCRLHDVGIPPRRIRIGLVARGVEGAEALGKDEKVVPVEMHGVGCVGGVDVVVENDADGGGLAEVVNVPLGGVGVGDVSLVGFAKDGVAGLICVRNTEL